MKKILYFFAACLAFSFAGCESEPDIDINTNGGKGLEFVHFNAASDSWVVAAEDESFVHNVSVACTEAHDKDIVYEVALGEKTTGVEGTDFSIATKSVTIPAGEYTAELPVTVLYATTGEGFEIELVLSVEDELINGAYGNSCLVTVKTDKVTIDWNWLEGTWDATEYYYYYKEWDTPYKVSFAKVDDTHATFTNFFGVGLDMTVTVDFDARTISIPGYQYKWTTSKYGDVYFIAVNPDDDFEPYADLTTPLVGVMSPTGIVFDNYDFKMTGDYADYTYYGGLKTVFTK